MFWVADGGSMFLDQFRRLRFAAGGDNARKPTHEIAGKVG
jgi:hypothetical protein